MGKRIKEARAKAGMTQEELANKIGVTTVTIWRWESNQRPPRSNYLDLIAGAVGCSVTDLIPDPKRDRVSQSRTPGARILTPDDIFSVPLLCPASVACAGCGRGSMDSIILKAEEFINLPKDWIGPVSVDKDKQPFAIRVEGDSMAEAGITDRSEIVVNPVAEVRNGDPALVCFGRNSEWAIKWVYFHPDGRIELRSSSTRYPAMTFTEQEQEEKRLRIIGRITFIKAIPKRGL